MRMGFCKLFNVCLIHHYDLKKNYEKQIFIVIIRVIICIQYKSSGCYSFDHHLIKRRRLKLVLPIYLTSFDNDES